MCSWIRTSNAQWNPSPLQTTLLGRPKKQTSTIKSANYTKLNSNNRKWDDSQMCYWNPLPLSSMWFWICFGEVQKRTTVKTYEVIFTYLVMMAVHIETMFAYDTISFLMALSRFASVLGWEEIIYSDHGSELVERNGNSGKLGKESSENLHIRRDRERINLGVWACR